MLIQFVVENFLSFRDKQILSMRAPEPGAARIGAAFEEGKQQTVRAGGEEILRCAVLYGANASGKSNLVRAIKLVRSLVLEGTPSKQRIARRPFKLDPARRDHPSRFELTFVHEGVLYSYGFLLDDTRVHAEWLHRGPEDGESLLFRRDLDATSGQYQFEVGDALAADPTRKQFYEFLHLGTRPNQLFLTEAEERNAPELAPPLTWFRERLEVSFPNDGYVELHKAVDTDPAFGAFLTELLAGADTGIQGISTTRFSSSDVPENVRTAMETILGDRDSALVPQGGFSLFNDDGEIEALTFLIRHGDGERAGTFTVDEESDGTQRLMHLARVLYRNDSDAPRIFIIDEIDRSLHPLLTRFFLQEFLCAGSAASPSQLIFTTHDTNLLDVNLLPPSSIWFVEKDHEGSSHLYSLDEFDESQIAALRDQTEEGYLAGRFGAIPFFGNRQRLVSAAKPEADGED
jgi:AAA15 family ATPase/GTPase